MRNLNYLPSSNLYTNPSFMKGVARTFDLFGTLDGYNFKKSGEKIDAESLKRDWAIVGKDLLHAMKSYVSTKK